MGIEHPVAFTAFTLMSAAMVVFAVDFSGAFGEQGQLYSTLSGQPLRQVEAGYLFTFMSLCLAGMSAVGAANAAGRR